MNKPSQILVGLSVLLFLLSRGSPAFSQPTVSPSVVASVGSDTLIGNTNLSYTVGESVIQTLAVGSTNIVSQGFQQPNYDIVVSIVDGELPDDIRIFPNPTTGMVMVQVGNQHFTATVYDLNGKMVVQAQQISSSTPIDLSGIAAGKYLLHLRGQTSYKFSIIKIN